MGLLKTAMKHPVLSAVGGAAAGAAVFGGMWAYGLGHKVRPDEKAKSLPGDDLIEADAPKLRLEAAITIDAPKEQVWPFIAQIGQRRAGFYSFDWLERLFTFHIYNTYTPVEEWQDMCEGEFIFYHQAGIGSEIKEVKPGEYFTSLSDTRRPPQDPDSVAFRPPFGLKDLAFSWNWFLFDEGDGKTRFMNRCDCTFEPYTPLRKWLLILIFGTPSLVMNRHMLDVLKQVAEGRKKEPGQLVRRLLS
jgi:hypothetical protein